MIILHPAPGALSALGPYRTRPGWEVCQENGTLWLRCPLPAAPAGLPCAAGYSVDSGGRLIPVAGTVPVARAPAGPWESLADFLAVLPFSALLPGRPPPRLAITLERSAEEMPPSGLLVTLSDLQAWAGQASRLRLARLKFAAAADGRIFVQGRPLPSVSGTPYYFQGRLALPCGWDFAPPLWPAWVEQSLTLPPGAVALIDSAARVEVLPQEAFVPLTLAALRRTLAARAPV